MCSVRADHVGAYGYGRDTTPNLDRIAKESVVFEKALSDGGWCLPSYASLYTGHYPRSARPLHQRAPETPASSSR